MWLLAAAVRQAIQQAETAGIMPTIDQQTAYEARYYGEGDSDSAPRLLTIAGDVAEIAVTGVLTSKPDIMSMIFGGGNSTYKDIIAALAVADSDPAVKRAELYVDSPGGTVSGLFDAIAAIQSFSKPLDGVVGYQAASAAYALVSQTDRIIATNRASSVGSIGVVTSRYIDEDVVDISSTKSPKKRPDIATEEGRAVVREELDALYELFVDAIATGRKTTPDKINAEFGQGAMVLASEALNRGMIDSIAETPLRVVKSSNTSTTATTGGDTPENGPMDLNALKAQHPDTYAAAVQKGIEQERDRASAHLVAGEMSGDMKTAIDCAKNGTEMTATLQTQYMMAAANRSDVNARQDDDATVAAGADGAQQSAPEAGADVVALVEQMAGITGSEVHGA